jgi:hypothetical protein
MSSTPTDSDEGDCEAKQSIDNGAVGVGDIEDRLAI